MSTGQTAAGSLILIVDDNAANLSVVSTELANAGYEIAVARDGEMALEQVGYEPPALILLDVRMPGIDGYEVFQRLQATPATRDIPVIFMTAVSETAEKVRALSLGAVDYVTKPFQQEELLARVQVHLKLRSLTRAVEERNARLEKEISERAGAEAALESLNRTLEQRVLERTAALSYALDELKRAQLHVQATVKAAQAIAGEIRFEQVLDRLMRIVIEIAGVRRGVLILERDAQLMVEAAITKEPESVRVGTAVPLAAFADLPRTLVEEVAQRREPVILNDPAARSRFSADPYMATRRPKSILCLSMTHHERLTGILYLENDLATGAFAATQLELLRLLLAQAAIAVENALLYEHVNETGEDLRRANAALESEVARRTEELRQAKERLENELAQRERAEEARAALQREIIEVQNTRLAELSTPFIPITDEIMVMPLIGTMDQERASQVLDTALAGVAAHHARAVIIDITGVKLVDASVAGTLVRVAEALRLLGANTVITGIRGDMARALIGMNLDPRHVVTRGTLKGGIAYALGRKLQ